MASPVKLYNHAMAPNPRRVRIFAAEKGIELSLERYSRRSKPHARIPRKELVRWRAGVGARRRLMSLRVDRDLPLSGGGFIRNRTCSGAICANRQRSRCGT